MTIHYVFSAARSVANDRAGAGLRTRRDDGRDAQWLQLRAAELIAA
jgi:hypothetical protein